MSPLSSSCCRSSTFRLPCLRLHAFPTGLAVAIPVRHAVEVFHCSLPVLVLPGVVLPYTLPSSHGVSLLLPSLLLEPFQNLWLVSYAFSTFPPQCFLPLLPILLFLCRFLLLLLRFQFPLPSELVFPFPGILPFVAVMSA